MSIEINQIKKKKCTQEGWENFLWSNICKIRNPGRFENEKKNI